MASKSVAAPCHPAVSSYLNYALSLLRQVPVTSDDPINLVSPEADYHLNLIADESHFDELNSRVDKLQAAKKALLSAKSIVEQQPDSMEKVDVLSALGEVCYKLGEIEPNARLYYRQALLVVDQLSNGSFSLRRGDLYYKVGICFEAVDIQEAYTHLCKSLINYCSVSSYCEAEKFNLLNKGAGADADADVSAKAEECLKMEGLVQAVSNKLDSMEEFLPASEV